MLDLALFGAISHTPPQLSHGSEFSTCCNPSQFCEPSCNACVVDGCGSGGAIDQTTHTTALGAGPEVYNNMAASHNCVGGSEQGCIPDNPPVGDPSKTGMTTPLPPPASWYANSADVAAMAPAKAISVPVAAGAELATDKKQTAMANPGHLVLGAHAFTLAALQGVYKGDFSTFKDDAVKNAAAVTPVGGYVVRQITA
jgi:hypothetical protein